MQIESYTNKKGRKLFRPILESREDAESGFCIGCGVEVSSGVEPDARNYTCEMCGENKVYGIEELVIMGIAKVVF